MKRLTEVMPRGIVHPNHVDEFCSDLLSEGFFSFQISAPCGRSDCGRRAECGRCVRFGELAFFLRWCAECGYDCAQDVLEDIYGVAISHDLPSFCPTAYRSGPRWVYSWRLCKFCKARPFGYGEWVNELTKDEHQSIATARKTIVFNRSENGETTVENRFETCWYCSKQCYCADHGLLCSECGTPVLLLPDRKFTSYCEAIMARVGMRKYTDHWAELHTSRFCSRQCCLLALRRLYRKEQEENAIQGELKCVQGVKRVLQKARKQLLNNPSPEALKSLKQEFELAATSQG